MIVEILRRGVQRHIWRDGCGLYLEPAQYLAVPLDISGIPDDGKNTFERSRGAAFFGKLKAPRENTFKPVRRPGGDGCGLYLEPT